MSWFFGSKKEEPKAAPAPSLQEASAKLDLQVAVLNQKIDLAEKEVKDLIAKNDPNVKQKAMQIMKRKKMYETQRDQFVNTQFTLEQVAFTQENADVQALSVAALKGANDQMKSQSANVSAEKVEEIMDDVAEQRDEAEAIAQALASGANMTGVGEDDVAAEFAKLEEEMALMKLMEGGGGGLPATAAPVAAPAATAAASSASPAALPAGP